jgi:hypothetical protein
MTRKYWAGIIAGMLGVFVVGMLLATGVNKGKAFVVNNFPSSLMLLQNTGFKLDGDRIGDIQRLQLMRSRPGIFDSAVITVSIDDSAEVNRISSCIILRATETHPFGSATRFKCASHSDSTNLDLTPFGHIVLPNGKTKTFYVAASALDQARDHAYRGAGSSDSGDVDIQAKDDNFSVTVGGHDVIRFSDDSNGGSFVLRDKNGKTIVQFNGGDSGGSFQINDGNGHKIIDIHGGKNSKSVIKP